MIRGSCLCGAVAFEIEGPLGEAHNCHCSRCRKSHGAAFSTYAQVPRTAFRFTRGEKSVRRYRSSPPCERTFCGECGSNLQFVFDGIPDSFWVALGALDDDAGARPVAHMFVGSKAAWHDIIDELPRFDEYPPGMEEG
jgi:hypothetical protein